MRLLLTVLLAAVLVPVLVAGPAVAESGKDCKVDPCKTKCCCKCKKTDQQITNFVHDVTIPWPFRKHVSDADGDGVTDNIDKCPNTPKGARVDAVGCPMDADGDGVYDGIDQCPDTPKDAKVDEKGCSGDSDGDGVADGIDRCPNTPKGVKVDRYGCTEMETEFLDTGVIRTSEIRFETGKVDIKPESYPIVDQVGTTLAQWPELNIEIGGHTDNVGTDENNQKLSEKRAQAVMGYLVTKHPDIAKGQFTTKGYGESTPITTNDTPEGRAQNRRVEFTILNKEVLKRESPLKR